VAAHRPEAGGHAGDDAQVQLWGLEVLRGPAARPGGLLQGWHGQGAGRGGGGGCLQGGVPAGEGTAGEGGRVSFCCLRCRVAAAAAAAVATAQTLHSPPTPPAAAAACAHTHPCLPPPPALQLNAAVRHHRQHATARLLRAWAATAHERARHMQHMQHEVAQLWARNHGGKALLAWRQQAELQKVWGRVCACGWAAGHLRMMMDGWGWGGGEESA
jgi:hypothetical protein